MFGWGNSVIRKVHYCLSDPNRLCFGAFDFCKLHVESHRLYEVELEGHEMPIGFFTRKRRRGSGEQSSMPYGAAVDSNQTLTIVAALQTQHYLFLSHIRGEINEEGKQNGVIG